MNIGRLCKTSAVLLAVLFLFTTLPAQEKPGAKGPAVDKVAALTKSMTDRLLKNLHVKHAVGKPVKAGKVVIVPIVMIDVGFGGGGGGPGTGPNPAAYGFGLGGEVKPLGFVVIGKDGAKFVPVGKVPRK